MNDGFQTGLGQLPNSMHPDGIIMWSRPEELRFNKLLTFALVDANTHRKPMIRQMFRSSLILPSELFVISSINTMGV